MVTGSFYIPPTVHRCAVFSASLLILVSSCLLDASHFKACAVIFHYGFCLHFVIISDVETLFMYLLVICMVFWGKFLFSSYVHFLKIELFGFCFWVVWVPYVFIYIYIYILTHIWNIVCKYFLSFCRLPFHFCRLFLLQCRAFSLMYQVSLVNFCLVLLVSYPKKSCCQGKCEGVFPYFLLGVLWYRVLCLSL